ncbi:hypothetical protein DAEQUDRAFT_757495 [Daedalea quercina L-15889]|uniref:Knr4/Smi1-like domain-containing protein n=1 Tax=Daedalea quercina L-15889 TaxID=1314783 RepID=A0A165PTL7_9APHY|nr:hypothetical protein DAEQUDRAFT_757495 [Daedalea quercina L-15889]
MSSTLARGSYMFLWMECKRTKSGDTYRQQTLSTPKHLLSKELTRVFIPGHKGALNPDDPGQIATLQSLLISSKGLAEEWRSEEEIIRHSSDSATTLESLAALYKVAEESDQWSEFPPRAFQGAGSEDTDEVEREESAASMASTTPAEDLSRMISEQSPSEKHTFLDPTRLLPIFPKMQPKLGEQTVMKLELIWKKVGERPAVPWDAPSEKEVDDWDKDQRESYHLPHEEDREDVLKSLKVRVALGQDRDLYPYMLCGAIVMALDAVWVDEARQWMSDWVQNDKALHASWPTTLASSPTLINFAVTGLLSEITGHTAAQAEQDAAIISQALLAFPETSAAVYERQRAITQRFTGAPWPALVRMLDTLKLPIEGDDWKTLLLPPASPLAIRETEERLGVELPADFKDFLLVSNGLDTLTIDAPPLKPVEELCWESPEELDLDWFRVTLGCDVTSEEEEQLPAMKRVLVLSRTGEEALWYIEPDTVGQTAQQLKAMGESDDAVGHIDWRLVLYIHWVPDTKWYKSFKDYVGYLAQEAEKEGAVLVQEPQPVAGPA